MKDHNQSTDREDHSQDYVRVYYTFVPTNIINAKMILESQEIQYITRNEDFAALYPGVDGMSTVDFLVKKTDEERAKNVLKELIEGEH